MASVYIKAKFTAHCTEKGYSEFCKTTQQNVGRCIFAPVQLQLM